MKFNRRLPDDRGALSNLVLGIEMVNVLSVVLAIISGAILLIGAFTMKYSRQVGRGSTSSKSDGGDLSQYRWRRVFDPDYYSPEDLLLWSVLKYSLIIFVVTFVISKLFKAIKKSSRSG